MDKNIEEKNNKVIYLEDKKKEHKAKRILIIQLESVMEIVMSTSFIQELKREFKNSKIEIVIIDEFKDCIEDAPFIDIIHPVGYSIFEKMNNIISENRDEIYNENYIYNFINSLGDFDMVYNLSHDSFSCWLNDNIFVNEDKKGGVILPTWEWVYADRWQTYFIAMNEFRDKNRFAVVDIMRGMLEKKNELGIEPYITVDDSEVNDKIDRDMVALSIGFRKMTQKNLEYFADIAVILYDNGYQPILVGDSLDVEEYKKVVEMSGGKALNYAGEIKYSKIAGLISQCVLLISLNELMTQVAAATGVPAITLVHNENFYWELAPYTANHIIVMADIEKKKKTIYSIPPAFLYFIAKYKLGIISDKQFREIIKEYPEVEIVKPFFINSSVDAMSSLGFESLSKNKRNFISVYNDIVRLAISNIFNNNEHVDYNFIKEYINKTAENDLKGIDECKKAIENLYKQVKFLEMNYQQWFTVIKRNVKRGKAVEILKGEKNKKKNMSERLETISGIIFEAENKLRDERGTSPYYEMLVPLFLIEIAMSQFEENYIYEGYNIYKQYSSILEIISGVLDIL